MVITVFRTRVRDDADMAALEALGTRMHEIATAMPGFVSYKDFTAADGESVTLVVFDTEQALRAWRDDPEHRQAQERGRREFFSEYSVQVCAPIREYAFSLAGGRSGAV